MANPFDQFDTHSGPMVGPPRLPPPQTAPQAQQDQLQVQHLGQQIQAQPLQDENTAVNIQQGRAGIQNQQFNQNQGLRQEFNNLPEVKNYSDAISSLAGAMKAPDNAQGDLAVVYSFAKAMDPGSVVREGEMDMANATASQVQQVNQMIQSVTAGKRLPPAVRVHLIDAARQKIAGLRAPYDQQYQRYSGLAHANGFDPAQIVGSPLYKSVEPIEEQYIRSHGGTPRDPNAPASPQANSGDTQIQFLDDAETRTRATRFHDELYGALSDRRLKSPAEVNAFVDQFNEQNHSNFKINWNSAQTTKAIRAALRGQRFGVESPNDPAVQRRVQQIQQHSKVGKDGTAATAAGAADVMSQGLDNKFAAGVNAIGQSLSGQGSFTDLYQTNLDADRQVENDLQQRHPRYYLGGQIAGGLVETPFIPGLASARTVPQLARVGGAMGFAHGFNSATGSYTDMMGQGLEEGAAGAVAGPVLVGAGRAARGGFRAVRNALSSGERGAVPPLVDPQTGALNQPLEAMSPGQRVVHAEEYGVNLPADAAGGRSAAIIGKGLDLMPGSAGVMEDARRATENQVAGAADVVGSRFGSSRTLNEAGAELQRGANERIARSETVTGKAYNAIPISPQAPASTSNAVATLQQLTGRFQSNPELADAVKDPKLATYLSALQSGKLNWNDLKQFRSIIGEKIGDMRFGEAHSVSDLRALYAGLSEDMKATASAMGPRALSAFNRANTLYRNEQQMIDGALTRILGKDGHLAPEKAAAAVQAMTKGGKSTGDLKTLAQIRSATIRSGAWNEIAGTLIRLGGQPVNSTGRDFNPQTFVNWYADMAEPARGMLFGQSELRKALDGFVAVNQRLMKVNALRNTSNTAGSMTAAGTVGVMGGALINPLLGLKLAGIAVGNFAMAKAWTNPGFVRLMTGYSKALASGDQQAVRSQIGRIGKLAATNPDLREPLVALQQRLANDNFTQSVASQPNNGQQRKDNR